MRNTRGSRGSGGIRGERPPRVSSRDGPSPGAPARAPTGRRLFRLVRSSNFFFRPASQSQRCPSCGQKRRLASCAEVQSQRDKRPAPILLQRCTPPREHAHPAGAGAVRTTIDDARRVAPLAAPGPWLVPTLTYPRGPNFVDSSDFTSRGRRTRAWRRTRRSLWRASRLGRTPQTSPRFRRRRTRSR